MNELFEQFVTESRDLVDQATTALLVLERSPADGEARDALFRALHTLKGGSSIIDFTAMERAVHAAEDVLNEARAAHSPITMELIGHCLACLDQVVRWLDSMQTTGELPPHADEEANHFVRRVAKAVGAPRSEANQAPDGRTDWVERLFERREHLRTTARTAVRFAPRTDSFFRGEDPLAIVGGLPGLLALDHEPLREWPALSALDPYTCMLAFCALVDASHGEVAAHLHEYAADCEIVSLPSSRASQGAGELPPMARRLLEAQAELLTDATGAGLAGIIAAAGASAVNVLRYCGLGERIGGTTQVTERSLNAGTSAELRTHLEVLLTGELAPARERREEVSPADASARTLRVEAPRIDDLVRLTGELTVVKNAIGHAALLAHADDNPLANVLKSHHGVLDRVTGEMQRAVLGMRVLPLSTVLQRLPRIVREMSSSLDKPARMVIEGDQTEADKAIVEMLFEPLLHVVRNSMDHGIEKPAQRASRNKAPIATIVVRASRQAEQVVIEVEDDGGGVDVERVRAVARHNAVAPADVLEAMAETEVVDLIFAPGFSTAAKVTELSGRGVGMDVVRKAVARVGGRVTLESRSGVGALVRFILPFSVMMTHVMTVEAGEQTFGIPLEAVIETAQVSRLEINGVGAARAIVRRNRTIPVFDLANILSVRSEPLHESKDAYIVIVSFAGQLIGIEVDRPGERMEVMLKPLEGLLAGIPGISGTTILGDGRVLLVLDLDGILQ